MLFLLDKAKDLAVFYDHRLSPKKKKAKKQTPQQKISDKGKESVAAEIIKVLSNSANKKELEQKEISGFVNFLRDKLRILSFDELKRIAEPYFHKATWKKIALQLE